MALSPEQRRLAIEWTGAGLTSEAIAERLLKEQATKVSSAAIRKLVKKTRNERREMVQTAAAVKLGEHVMSDLDNLALAARMARRIVVRTGNMAFKHAGEGTIHAEAAELCLKAVKELKGVSEARLKFAGLDEKVEPEKASDEELAKLVEKALAVVGGKR